MAVRMPPGVSRFVVVVSFDCWTAGAATGEPVDSGADVTKEEAPLSAASPDPPASAPKGSSHHIRTRAPASEVPETPSRTRRPARLSRPARTGEVTGWPDRARTGGGPNPVGPAAPAGAGAPARGASGVAKDPGYEGAAPTDCGFSGYGAGGRCHAVTGPAAPDSISASRRSSTADDGRAAGSRTSTLISTSPRAPARTGGGTSSLRTAARVARVLLRRSGWWPSTAVYSIIASDHRSEAAPPSWPEIRSGAMKSGVPMMEPVTVRLVVSRIAAMPKSVRTGRPSDLSRTLAGLTSRC